MQGENVKNASELCSRQLRFGRKNQEYAPRPFSVILQGENFQDVSELHSKPLRFWTHIS